MQNDISTFLPVNKENEEKAIAFLIQNKKETHRTKEVFFFDNICKVLYTCIKDINDTNYKCDAELLFDYTKKKNVIIDKNEIYRIIDTYKDFDNIKLTFIKLKEFYFENQVLKKVEQIANKTLSKKELDREGIKQLSISLEADLINFGDNERLLDTKELASRYRKELALRQTGIRKRSMGYPELDKHISRPGAPEETTLLIGFKGMGKSAYKLCIENNLINSGICTISFNPEMPTISNLDRLIGIRSGISLFDLLRENKEPQLLNAIERELRRIENLPNFIYIEEASLDIYLIRDLIQQAKQMFFERGVLPDDGYLLATYDTFDMLEDFESANPREIKANMNKYHRLISRKEKIHSLALLQGNENKLRGNIFKKPEDLEFYKIGVEDIEGGAAYAAKARLVLSLNRPVQMKKMIFPERMQEWDMERDLLNISGVKQNDGKLFFTQFSFDDNMRIRPYKKEIQSTK